MIILLASHICIQAMISKSKNLLEQGNQAPFAPMLDFACMRAWCAQL